MGIPDHLVPVDVKINNKNIYDNPQEQSQLRPPWGNPQKQLFQTRKQPSNSVRAQGDPPSRGDTQTVKR